MAQPEAVARRYKELGLRMPVEQAEQRLKQDLLSIRQELQEQGVDTTEGYADLDILREFGAPIERPKRPLKVKEIFRRHK